MDTPDTKENNIPISTTIRVLTEMSFINLLTELGYREDKSWTDEENVILGKLCELAKEHSEKIYNEHIESLQKENERLRAMLEKAEINKAHKEDFEKLRKEFDVKFCYLTNEHNFKSAITPAHVWDWFEDILLEIIDELLSKDSELAELREALKDKLEHFLIARIQGAFKGTEMKEN